MKRPASGNEAGFTLVELLMAMAVSGVIFIAITVATLTGIRNSDGSGARLTDSTDAQFAQAYFTTDVQSAELINQSGSGCPGASGAPVLTLQWTDRSTSPQTNYVSVWTTQTVGSSLALHRVTCTTTAPGTFTGGGTTSDLTLSTSIAPGSVQTSCADAAGSPIGSCRDSGADPFATVRLNATSTHTSNEQVNNDTYVWVLKAARRAS